MDHHILPRKIKKDEIKAYAEKLISSVKRHLSITKLNDEFKDQMKFYVSKFFKDSNQIYSSPQNSSLHNTLNKIQKDDEIRICHYDKGRGVAILNKNDYYSKLDTIIEDQTKFAKVNFDAEENHPVIAKESSIEYYVKTYFKSYGKKVVGKLTPSGSVPGKLYGRIKIHKKGYPARPVVSMINTPEYQLAKLMDRLIKPYIPNKYMLDSTQDFLQKMNEFTPKKEQITVSFDVISLFTNVPLAETIELIASYVYAKDNPSCPPFNKDIFVKLMFKATQGLFLYKDELYQQINGVTMESPLGPTLANFFMANLETKLINKLQTSKPKLYLRYVDDIFAIFDNQEACSSFFRQLNTQHSRYYIYRRAKHNYTLIFGCRN